MTESSPIFSKTYAFMIWIFRHTSKFPKNERFRIAKQLDDSIILFYSSLLELVYCQNKVELIEKADVELAKLRTFARLSKEMSLTSINQYEYFAIHITEIGRLLGGWKRTLA